MTGREARRKTVGWIRRCGFRWAAGSPAWLVDALERTLAGAGPWTPMLSSLVTSNMRAAGVYTRSRHKAYFSQAALHLTNALRVLQERNDRPNFQALAREQVRLDASVAIVKEALTANRGAVIAGSHSCNFLMTVARLRQEVPLTVYLRWSEDAVKRSWKEAWCRAAGVRVIIEPENAADPTTRAARCVEALREGAALVMTPDIAQKVTKGVPVELFGRRAFVPTGPASIAMLAEAPLIPVTGRLGDGLHTIVFHEPIFVRRLSRAEGGRKAAMAEAMAKWAVFFEQFLCDYPEAWFLWADSRWTRVFRNDPKYAQPAHRPESDATES